MSALIWIVMDGDGERDWVVAVYSTEAMAKEHESLIGGYVAGEEIRGSLHPDAIDPVKQAERRAEIERQKRHFDEYQAYWKRREEMAQAQRPHPPHMGLCCCETFTANPLFRTEHGYCSFCGGWEPRVFAKHMGAAALHSRIDDLNVLDRDKMREIAGSLA